MIQINIFQVRQPVRLQGEHHRQPQEDHRHHVRREAGGERLSESFFLLSSCVVMGPGETSAKLLKLFLRGAQMSTLLRS